MFDFLASYDLILSVQKWSNPFLDVFFLAITQLGDGKFFILAFAYLFWCRDRKMAVRLSSVCLLSAVIVCLLKISLSLPRPDSSIVQSHHLLVAPTESFPSGHAAEATVFWGYLAFTLRKRWFSILSIVTVILVSFSRIYLGVHFLRDVLGGMVLGLFVLLTAFSLMRYWEKHPRSLPRWVLWGIALLLPTSIFFLSHDKRIAQAAGMLLGIWLGALAEEKSFSRDSQSQTGIPKVFSSPPTSLGRAEAKARFWRASLPTPLECAEAMARFWRASLPVDVGLTFAGLAGAGVLAGLLKFLPWPNALVKSFFVCGAVGFYLALIFPLILKKLKLSHESR